MKYYVVLVGRIPGMYRIWAQAKEQVDGYPGAIHKSFDNEGDALNYQHSFLKTVTTEHVKKWKPLSSRTPSNTLKYKARKKSNSTFTIEIDPTGYFESVVGLKNTYIAYTDGSYSYTTERCGFGIVLLTPDNIQENYCGNVTHVNKTNNVAELYAIYRLLESLTFQDATEEHTLIIYTDSTYCIQVLTGENNAKTKNLRLINRIKACMGKVTRLEFRHVKAHVGIKYNELADKLADVGREIDEPFVLHSVVDLETNSVIFGEHSK